MSQFDKRIKVNTVIENHLPEFIRSDFPNAIEFFKQYYLSHEYQGGASDLIQNFDQYIKVDNLVPEVVIGITSITADINSSDLIISVPSTKGFPSEYGLLKIDDEIISYTGITSTTFTGCIRGFSGVTGYNVGVSSSLVDVNKEKLTFEETSADSHVNGSTVQNLSVLFIQEFYKKLKKTFLPGFEDISFTSDLDVGNFIKFARSFYQSKGLEESIKILFKVLYGVDSTILDLESNLIKPSDAEFVRREVVIADLITETGDPQNLVGQTIFKSDDLETNASVSGVEIFNREGKTYYQLSLFVGYSDRDLIQGIFTVNPNTKVLNNVSAGSSVISVDSTVGFGTTGTIISGVNTIEYKSKTINQFFDCTGITNQINTADNIRINSNIFGYENGDLSKKIELRITGVLSKLIVDDNVTSVNEGEKIFVKHLGQKIFNNSINYKEKFANSWIYNTSSRFKVNILASGGGGNIKFDTLLDKSSIKVGDQFEVLRRGQQIVDGAFNVASVDTNLNQVITTNLGFTPVQGQDYDVRRVVEKATSSNIEIREGNENIISNILNVYTDGDTDGYVASNSLPDFNISDDVIKETIVGFANTSFEFPLDQNSQDSTSGLYSFLEFHFNTNRDIKFIQGDAIVYNSIKDPNAENQFDNPTHADDPSEVPPGLNDGAIYYVDPQPANSGSNITKLALYSSRGQIGTASSIQVGLGVSLNDIHTFTLLRQHGRKLSANKILRRFPLSQSLSDSSVGDENITDIAILKNGVEVRSPVSEDFITYGSLSSINIINGGEGYDVINPPKILIEESLGDTAYVEPVITGSVKEIFIDPQEFDVKSVKSVTLTGGNGDGCELEAVTGVRFRELTFDSRDINFGGGIDIENETITFSKEHNLENGQIVYYQSNGNAPIGIGAAFDSTNQITGALANGDPYYVRYVNPKTVTIYNTQSDALSGINTIGIATDTAASGIHVFRTEPKNTITSIKVKNSGEGYEYRNLIVKPSGISTSFDTVNFVNHGFKHGDLINYSPMVGIGSTMPKEIQGLSTASSYYVMKVDDNSFKLANAGVGGTSTVDFDRGKFVGLNSTGTGYQTFKYPDIKVNIEVIYNGNVTGTFNITPVVTGSFTDAYLYEKGTDYGSKILNNVANPKVSIRSGNYASITPTIQNGKVVNVVVADQGENYDSTPEVKIISTGEGVGAIVRPVIQNGKVVDAIVISSGIGYEQDSTIVDVVSRGVRGVFGASIRTLQLNKQFRHGDTVLVSRDDFLSYNVIGVNQTLLENLEFDTFDVLSNGEFNVPTKHSSIIGWAYDGNPIYGPFGYSEPNNINSTIRILESSYVKDTSKVENRPSGFDDGFFIDDFIFDNSGDLDIHNGRFCKTPEFPNGIYAYFATVEKSDKTGKIIGKYPYFIGKTFRLPLIQDNLKLDHNFDFNNSNLIRNTYPYNVGEKFADNDFLTESNEFIRQISEVRSVSKGEIEDITVLNSGSDYRVGDLTSFDNTNTNGTGFKAEVSEIVGLGVSNIQTRLDRFEDLVFTWSDNNTVKAGISTYIELDDQDYVFVSGLSTSIQNLTNSFSIGVSTSRVSLGKTMSVVPNGNVAVEDIFVNKLPEDVLPGNSLRISSGNATDDEIITVLNVYKQQRIIRASRGPGAAHTFGSNVDLLNNQVSIPVKTKRFDSQINDVIYFNGPQQIGLGTAGIATNTNYVVGETTKSISIPNRQIYLPNHPFVTGQRVKLNVPAVSNRQIDVANTNDPNDTLGNFSIPYDSSDTTIDLFVIKKSENYIGLSTVSIGSTSDGLFFKTNASAVAGINTHLYNISSQFDQVTGDIDKVVSTVTTKVAAANTTTHNLQNGDVVSINVVPNHTVGIGTTGTIEVNYNSEYQKLLINQINFTNTNVESNRINIENHGFNTGDKVFYDGNAGLGTGSYFVYKVNSQLFQLTETFNDLSANPIKIIEFASNSGGSKQSIAPINPQIKVYKNSKVKFGLSTTTLAGFDFKIFYSNGENEFNSSQDSTIFNVGTAGTVGIGTETGGIIDASLTLESTSSTPSVLYYGVTKGGYISTADSEVVNGSQIIFLDSIYNGEYKISGVTSETFNFSPKVPEFLSYDDTDCEKIEYSTKSTNVKGGIKKLKILSKGFNYKQIPLFKEVTSTEGLNANLVAESNNIGKIENVRVLDIGYEYSADKTLQPEVFIPSILNIDNLDTVINIDVVNGGFDYTTPPNLILFNPESNTVVDTSSLSANVPNQSISSVDLVAPINGLQSVQHKVFTTNNSNGIGINQIQTSSGGLVTCFLETPFNGFLDPQPFEVGDEIFVEGIQRIGEAGGLTVQGGETVGEVLGEGFNSQDHNFTFFKVLDYISGSTSIVKFSVAGVTTNPGVAKSFQSGYATIVNKKKYPEIIPVQSRGVFQKNEPLILNGENSDLSIIETRDDYIKLDGLDITNKGDRITGRTTGVSAEIIKIKPNLGRFEINFSNRQEYGWLDDIGKLNEDLQVIPDNDYYQNLSYSVKSPITWDKFSNSVNSIVHPAGLKNFADTFVQRNIKVGVKTENDKSISNIILDIVSDDNRVDAINNFDNVLDYNSLGDKTKTLLFSQRKLTNFTKCISNRVLLHDDISGGFSSVGFAANSSVLEEINGKFVNYLIQVIDPDSFDVQLSELVVLTKEDEIILLEKTTDSTGVGLDNIDSNLKLGDFSTEITTTSVYNLLFNPVEKFTKDHDIKILKTFYDDDIPGVSSNVIGSINLISANVGIASAAIGFNTTTIVEFDKDQFNGLQANIFVQDTITKEINYNEVILDFDGVNTTLSQVYSDDTLGLTNNTVGIITARLENNLVKLQIENDRTTPLDSKSSIVGLGTTTAGIGTHRFLSEGQPPGAERSVRFESTFNQGTGILSVASINKTIDSSIKSLVKVSTGQTSAIHQVTAIRDAEDILVVQYPFVSLGSTSGIGSFTSATFGDDISINFVPDPEFTDEIKVQAYNQVFYTASDFSNVPATLSYGNVDQEVLLSTYDGLEGARANKTEFDLKYQGTPIYTKTFNPDGVGLEKSTGVFTIPNHFFNTNEELVYSPDSSFIGVAATPVSIGSTVNSAGITTDIMPSTVFAKVLSEDKFQLFPRSEDVASGIAITVTGVGSGNVHKLNMTKKLSKTLIGLDGVTQQPVTFTSLTHTLSVNIGAATTQFSLSGISSISTFDVLKINDEFMKIIEVGFSSTSDGSGKIDDQLNISEGLSTVPTVRVQRGSLGIGATSHDSGDIVRIHRGSFNIVDSKVHFIDPPKGNTRSRKTDTELPFVKADFSGRTFTRQNYTTNMLFDDISDNFTGLTTNYTLKVGGANTSAGIDVGNGVVFINGVYQRPFTANTIGNNYAILADTTSGISSIRFTGITSENGQFLVSPDDINQNQIPRGGLIVSLGSTQGLGYAPLVGAKVRPEKNASGQLTGIVGIGTSSGFNLGIQTAVYDNVSGIITVTTNDVHGFALDRPTSVKLKGLEFKCPKESVGTPTNATYTPSNGNFVITIPNHGLAIGDAIVIDDNAFTFTCAMDGNSSNKTYPRSTDPASGQYLTILNATTNTFRVNVGASPIVTYTPTTGTTYDPNTGLMVLEIGNHNLTAGTSIKLAPNSLTFSCGFGGATGAAAEKSYPRSNGNDPFYDTAINIESVTATTITLQVLTTVPSTNTDPHTFVSATAGAVIAGGNYSHTFVSAVANSVKTIGGGGYVGVTTTIFQDHERPLFVVGIVSERSFEVRAGASTIPHTYQGGGNAYEFYEDLTFGSGYRGTTVAIGVTDIAYEHKFVSSGIGSIRKDVYNGDAFTATDAFYESHSGLLTLIIPNHTFTTSDTVGIDTGGLVFKCSKDGFSSDHPYPRAVSKTSFPNSDPFAGTFVSIGSTSLESITFNVGAGGGGGTGAVVEATVGVGGTLAFTVTNPGTGYVNPQINIPEPTYENLEVVGISRLGVGATTETGSNLLLNVGVSAATTTVGIGTSLFEIKDFEITRSGYSFKRGDKFKPVGLVTAAHLSAPIQEFELEVLEIFNDKFSAWQFGEIDAIDSIKNLQDGNRTRFPLFFNGELISFEKILTDPRSALIDLDSVLLIFVNGVLQKPGEAYTFRGGTTFVFTEPPTGESQPGLNDHDQVDVYFYKGKDGTDVDIENVTETIQVGDTVRVFKSEKTSGLTTSQSDERIIKDILNTDIVDTDIYRGLGIDEVNEKPIRWTKQKNDLQINGRLVPKSRSILEPQVYPTSKIIGDLSETSGIGLNGTNSIFVDDAQSFFYESKYGIDLSASSVDALITSGELGEVAQATATIGAGGTISSINITEGGSGYTGTVDIGIEAPINVEKFVGIGTTATAFVTVTNGVVTDAEIINPGLGYDQQSTPPLVIIERPKFETERITGISKFEGFTGIITGITKLSGSELRFDFFGVNKNSNGGLDNAPNANILAVGYPVYIKDTKVGNGLTTVNPDDAHVVGIGTTFLDNVYIVNSVDYSLGGSQGAIICKVHSNSASSINGIAQTGFYDPTNPGLTTSLGTINWGRLYGTGVQRSTNPISIGVTGLTVNAGLTTFPTLQRKSYDSFGETGHRNSGSIRAVISIT